jgi:hypothetical protein
MMTSARSIGWEDILCGKNPSALLVAAGNPEAMKPSCVLRDQTTNGGSQKGKKQTI